MLNTFLTYSLYSFHRNIVELNIINAQSYHTLLKSAYDTLQLDLFAFFPSKLSTEKDFMYLSIYFIYW